MCLIVDGYIPSGDLETLKKLGDHWNREITFFPVFHPEFKDEIARQGYDGEPVRVQVRIEVEIEEEPAEAPVEEDV